MYCSSNQGGKACLEICIHGGIIVSNEVEEVQRTLTKVHSQVQ